MITFKPLWKTLIDRDLKKSDLISLAGLSSQAIASMGKDEKVSLKTIDKICEALDCRIEDVVEYRREENMLNVYTAYDTNKTVIARIQDTETISKTKYNSLLRKRTIGGNAKIYTDANHDIEVFDSTGNRVDFIPGKGSQE